MKTAQFQKRIDDLYNKNIISRSRATKMINEILNIPEADFEKMELKIDLKLSKLEQGTGDADIQSQLNSIKKTVESNHTILMFFVYLSIISVLLSIIVAAQIS